MTVHRSARTHGPIPGGAPRPLCGRRRFSSRATRPVLHQGPPPLEEIRSRIGGRDPVLYNVRQGRLDHFPRVVGLLGHLSRNEERHPCATAAVCSCCNIFGSDSADAERAPHIADQATYNTVATMDGIRRSYSASNLATPPKMLRNDDATRNPSLLAHSRSLSAPGQSFWMHRASAR